MLIQYDCSERIKGFKLIITVKYTLFDTSVNETTYPLTFFHSLIHNYF